MTLSGMFSRLQSLLRPRLRIILDTEDRLGDFSASPTGYRTDLIKEEVSRRHVFSHPGNDLNFLDVGARDGQLTYLLGMSANLKFDQAFYDQNMASFKAKYRYHGMDLLPADDERVLSGDACDPAYLDQHPAYREKFDVIYSNNVFEHFERPWIAAANLNALLKPGGLIITVVPFAQRYHESPGDFFRYTHKGIEALFASAGQFEVLESGYDICGRRTNWQGGGKHNDIVPLDKFGAWRETWFSVCVVRKLG